MIDELRALANQVKSDPISIHVDAKASEPEAILPFVNENGSQQMRGITSEDEAEPNVNGSELNAIKDESHERANASRAEFQSPSQDNPASATTDHDTTADNQPQADSKTGAEASSPPIKTDITAECESPSIRDDSLKTQVVQEENDSMDTKAKNSAEERTAMKTSNENPTKLPFHI